MQFINEKEVEDFLESLGHGKERLEKLVLPHYSRTKLQGVKIGFGEKARGSLWIHQLL